MSSCGPRAGGQLSSRKVARNHAASQRMGSASLRASRCSLVLPHLSHSFCSEGLATVVRRTPRGCGEPSKAERGIWHAAAEWRVTTTSSVSPSELKWSKTC